MEIIRKRYILAIGMILILVGCTEKNPSEFKNYCAVAGDTTGLLSVAEHNSSFYGRYEVYYGGSVKIRVM